MLLLAIRTVTCCSFPKEVEYVHCCKLGVASVGLCHLHHLRTLGEFSQFSKIRQKTIRSRRVFFYIHYFLHLCSWWLFRRDTLAPDYLLRAPYYLHSYTAVRRFTLSGGKLHRNTHCRGDSRYLARQWWILQMTARTTARRPFSAHSRSGLFHIFRQNMSIT